MNMEQNLLPIGVFDSGVGGISVLAELIKTMPSEKYLYFADSANAPYGTKTCDCVRMLSLKNTETMYKRGIKALVIACNTATSVAINNIRQQLDIPVIGMEPALKPAVENGKKGLIVVMATPLTLKEEKFNTLYSRYTPQAAIMPLPCPGLVELIESEAGSQINDYLHGLLQPLGTSEVSAVVLGCTHYCFVKKEISGILGPGVQIVDGNAGTVRHLKRTLAASKLLNQPVNPQVSPQVEFLTSGDEDRVIPICRRFLAKAMEKGNSL